MKRLFSNFFRSQQSGLILVILALGFMLTMFAGTRVDHHSHQIINKFLNSKTVMQVITDAVFFAIMAVGVTMVIITGGIDLSVGAIYALAGVVTAMVLRSMPEMGAFPTLMVAIGIAVGVGTLCGLVNGVAVVGLRVHPFIITLGTMWIYRGIAFISSKAESILLPDNLIGIFKSPLGLDKYLHPVPMLIMLAVMIVGEVYLLKTVMGRNVYAVGGNAEASRYCGLKVNKTLISVYVIAGLTAGIAALIGSSFYGSASCKDADGYELYVVASAVVGGASLMGGKGSAFGAMLGALLIVLIKQSITTLRLNENYQWIIVGCAIIIAVVLDRVSADLAKKRMAREAARKIESIPAASVESK